jgi:hypothetical protein
MPWPREAIDQYCACTVPTVAACQSRHSQILILARRVSGHGTFQRLATHRSDMSLVPVHPAAAVGADGVELLGGGYVLAPAQLACIGRIERPLAPPAIRWSLNRLACPGRQASGGRLASNHCSLTRFHTPQTLTLPARGRRVRSVHETAARNAPFEYGCRSVALARCVAVRGCCQSNA